MNSFADIVSNYELNLKCNNCGAQTSRTIGWVRTHRDMPCPGCSALIVLNTSRITAEIRGVEKRLGDLQSQLAQKIRKL